MKHCLLKSCFLLNRLSWHLIRITPLLGLLLGLTATTLADTAPPASPASRNHPALWKVTPATESATAYLFGSIHLGNKAMYPLATPIMEAFHQADHLVVELDTTTLDPMEVSLLLIEKGMYSGEETLADALSPATWTTLHRVLARYRLSVEPFTKHRPWLIAVTLAGMEFNRSGYEEAHGIDHYFLEQAKGHKPIIELESFTEQMDLFAQFSPREQETFLATTLHALEQGTPYIESLVASWMKGDEETLNQLMMEAMKRDPTQLTVYDVVVKNRNRAMSHKIAQLLKEKKTLFVVVGSLHIIGEDGLVQLLTHQGYRAEKISGR